MKNFIILFFAVSNLAFANPPFWGKTGHRVVGEVAEMHLKRKARKMVRKILKGRSLASVSNYADDIKSDTLYRKYYPWHYVNYPADKTYVQEPPAEEGDIVQAIETCIAKLRDKNSPEEEQIFYLKMLVHFIGDLHQPLHAGWAENRGGNDIEIEWFGRESNLHRLWDSDLIDHFGMSYTELARDLPPLSKEGYKALKQGDVYSWVEESHRLATSIYGSVIPGERLGYRYKYIHWNTVERQLLKGGVRLAVVLNEIFD
ncbi:S1/P1 nuclease [Muriicola marianensis]|uniref:Endonuclease n=1 Tax=Muriicola marianensis TaxID=1324801 RepID=A0ABQ1QUB6_9FLAO|nr:S1/P1 nuclease [Muriicola marianensis]GGD43835.1 endonuclease [Muriicola marianensis]